MTADVRGAAMTDEPRVDGSPRDAEPARARRWPLLGIACACLLVIASGVLYLQVADPFRTEVTFCAGVGLVGGRVSSSPQGAFDAWLATQIDQPPSEAWRRDGNEFTNLTYRKPDGHGYRSVQVSSSVMDLNTNSSLGPDEWVADGACV
jgi:hypothetical protein